jgi:hypothetical protein
MSAYPDDYSIFTASFRNRSVDYNVTGGLSLARISVSYHQY